MKQSIAILLLTAACLVGTTIAASAGDEMRFLDGLRQRRLFGLAETYCQKRLATTQLSETERAQLITELIRVFAEHAVNLPPPQRAPLWQRAHRTATDFRTNHAGHPRLVLVLVQDALAFLSEGELARREAEVAPRPQSALEAARGTIRKAIAVLEEIDKRLGELIPLARRSSPRGDALTVGQLSSLQQNVRYLLARAYRNRALCYPLRSTDRVAALTQAIDQLKKPLLELPPDDTLIWRIHLDQAVCQRLLGARDQAAQLLAELDKRKLSPRESLRVRAERARLQLSAGQTQQALLTIGKGRELEGVVSAELDFAHLETFVALWQAAGDAGDASLAQRWQQKSVAAVKFIEHTHGRYWARRAELLLIGTGKQRSTGSVEILARTADDLFLKGQLGDALLTYDKAARNARDSGRSDQAFELAYKAGLIEQQRRRNREASQRFRELALSHKDHPQSCNAHLLSILNAAEMAKEDATKLAAYVDLLEEHLSTWPGGQTANTVRVWLGERYEGDQEWGLAIDTYRLVPPDSKQYGTAVKAVAGCWLNWAAQRKASGEAVVEVALQAAAFCDQVVGDPDEQWTEAQRIGATTGAQVRLLYLPDRAAEAYDLLAAALAGSAAAENAWKSAARTLLVAALGVVPGRIEDARSELNELPDATLGDLLNLMDVMAAVSESAPSNRRREPAELQLAVVARLGKLDSDLDGTTRSRVAVARARALVSAQRLDDAIAAYRELAVQSPGDLAIQLAYAQTLSQADSQEHLRQALVRWRILASRTRPHSVHWLQAKYSVALTQFKLGDKRSAAKLIRYLQATEDLSAGGRQEQFAELLRRCNR